MDDSILNSVKSPMSLSLDDTVFDDELIIHINSVFYILKQLGVGPEEGYSIEDSTNTWDEFTNDQALVSILRVYFYLKVRLLFDPPSSSALMSAMQEQANEYEWRIHIKADMDYAKEASNG